MKLFGKKEKTTGCCSCGGACGGEETPSRVKVLGSGCAKCRELEENVKSALRQLGKEDAVEHVTDFARIAAYGVMVTPALVVDEQVLSSGKVLNAEEAAALLREKLA
jgi:small redox-active disulfide protein 2